MIEDRDTGSLAICHTHTHRDTASNAAEDEVIVRKAVDDEMLFDRHPKNEAHPYVTVQVAA